MWYFYSFFVKMRVAYKIACFTASQAVLWATFGPCFLLISFKTFLNKSKSGMLPTTDAIDSTSDAICEFSSLKTSAFADEFPISSVSWKQRKFVIQ